MGIIVMKHTIEVNFMLCALVFVCVGFFLMLTAITGCGHTHPIAEHEHPHEHDHHHTHQHDHAPEPLAEVLHRELVGTYRLESVERQWATGKVRGELTLTLEYKFVISAEAEYNLFGRQSVEPIDPKWWEWGDLFSWVPDTLYYRIAPDRPAFVLYQTAGHRFYHQPANALEYKWDGKVLTLIHFALRGDYSSDNVAMKWLKLE